MKESIEAKVQLMMRNFELLRKPYKWEHELVRHLVALTYANKGLEVELEEIAEVKAYIKSQTGVFSAFRGNLCFAFSGLLSSSSSEPKVLFDEMLGNQKILKNAGFKNSTYLPTALYALSVTESDLSVNDYVDNAYKVYREMKQNHPFLTSGDDYALAILLADSNHDTTLLEVYYEALNQRGFSKSNGLQMLSHILAFSEKEVGETVDQCDYIAQMLKAHKLKVYADFYPALGLMSLLDGDQGELANDLIEVATFLRDQKKYKWIGKGMNLLMASAIIASDYVDKKSGSDAVMSAALSVSIETIIAAQQAAMIAAITASTAAASTAT